MQHSHRSPASVILRPDAVHLDLFVCAAGVTFSRAKSAPRVALIIDLWAQHKPLLHEVWDDPLMAPCLLLPTQGDGPQDAPRYSGAIDSRRATGGAARNEAASWPLREVAS